MFHILRVALVLQMRSKPRGPQSWPSLIPDTKTALGPSVEPVCVDLPSDRWDSWYQLPALSLLFCHILSFKIPIISGDKYLWSPASKHRNQDKEDLRNRLHVRQILTNRGTSKTDTDEETFWEDRSDVGVQASGLVEHLTQQLLHYQEWQNNPKLIQSSYI